MSKREKHCRLCGVSGLSTIYDGPIRSGEPGSPSTTGFAVQHCGSCGLRFLDPFPEDIAREYREGAYWSARTADPHEPSFASTHLREQAQWLQRIGPERFWRKSVMDAGCGFGFFLDHVKGLARETVGFDVDKTLRQVLIAKGHGFVEDWDQLNDMRFDYIVSFDTLEHIKDPIAWLRECRSRIEPGGRFILGVPNADDMMLRLVERYVPFFYRKGHLFYFNTNNLRFCLEEAGFHVERSGFFHKYNIMNLVGWAKDGTPQGVPPTIFDSQTEAGWAANIERQGISSHIIVESSP